MDIRDARKKLHEKQKLIDNVQDNKKAIGDIKARDYKSGVYGGYDYLIRLTPEQLVIVNRLIVILLEQSNAEMEKELKPLADLLGVEEKPDNN